MTGGMQPNQPMMRSFTMANLIPGGPPTQKVIPIPWPATKTSSTCPEATAPPAVLRRHTDQSQEMVRVRSQSPGGWHVRLEDEEGKSMVRTRQKPFISGLPGSLRGAAVKEASQTTCHYSKANENQKPVLVTHAESRANEFDEPMPTTYGTKKASKSQAPVQTTCESDEALTLKELAATTYGSNKTNKRTERVQKLRTSSHANDFKTPVPNEFTEMVPKPRTCSDANDLKKPVPSTYGGKKADYLRLGSKVRLAGLKCDDRNTKSGVSVQFDMSGVCHVKLEDGEEIPAERENLEIETINRGLSDSTVLSSKAKHDDGEAASVTSKALARESSSVHISATCRSPTQITSSCHLEALRPGSQAGSPSKTLSLSLDGGSPSRTLNSGVGDSILVSVSYPTPSTNQVVLTELVPATYSYNMARGLKEPVPTPYDHNKSVESEGKAPVPTTYGYNKANELYSGAKVRLAGLESICYNGKRGHIVKCDRSGLWHVKLEDGQEIYTKTENLVVETSNRGHPNSGRLLLHRTSPDVSDATHAVWQQSQLALHRSLSANLLGQAATNSSFFHASPWAMRDPSAAQPSKIGQPPPVKLVVFDFDCTLSVFHVFASLAGGPSKWKLPVPAPHAYTERGQLQRLTELDAHPDWGPGVFALKAFGGGERVAQLRKALEALARKDVECIVCSRGFVGPIRKCLDQLNLLALFSHTLGSLGNHFCTSSYDEAAARTAGADHYLGSMDMAVVAAGASSKAETITTCMTTRGLKWCQVIHLDDDINEVKSSSVQRIHVAGENGIGDAELQLLRVMVDGGGPCENDTTPVGTPSTAASSRSSSMSEED